jgi:hypothetical protein
LSTQRSTGKYGMVCRTAVLDILASAGDYNPSACQVYCEIEKLGELNFELETVQS